MALHGRYTNGPANALRVSITFRRQDLLWKTDAVLVGPRGKPCVNGLPIRFPVAREAVGPTILDMMLREVVTVTDQLREQFNLPDATEEIAVWRRRPTASLWPKPVVKQPKDKSALSKKKTNERPMVLDHPFQRGLASGGSVLDEEAEFVRIEKFSTVSISEMALKLAIGMTGSIGDAYTRIAALATQCWAADLVRARKLWARIPAEGQLYEDHVVAQLRPVSSISQETELLILREACIWLGVDPDQDCSRPRGRPRESGVETGNILRMRVDASERLSGELIADFHGLTTGRQLSDLHEAVLVDLLGALNVAGHGHDFDMLEAFLDASAPGWRERAAATAAEPHRVSDRYDPYEVLNVGRDATLDEVTAAYRRAMQRVHPDVSNLGPWFAQVAAEAYRSIRKERGEQP